MGINRLNLFHFYIFIYFLIEGSLLYRIVLFSVKHRHESAIGIHMLVWKLLSRVWLFATGILQARILEWVDFPFSKWSSNPEVKPRSPTLQEGSLLAESQGKLIGIHMSSSFWNFLPSPSHPSTLIQSPCLSSLRQTANFRWLSILHMVM